MIKRLGVIGDLHGEHERLETVLDWFAGEQIDALVCTGDIADGRGCINRSCDLLRQADVLTVAGNHDRWLLTDQVRHLNDAHRRDELSTENEAFLNELPRCRKIVTKLGNLLLCHGVAEDDLGKVWPGRTPQEIKRSPRLDALLESAEYRFLINGHMHFRVMIDFDQLLMLNAGTLKGEHGGITVVDFAGDCVTAYATRDNAAPEKLVERSLSPCSNRKIWRNTAAFDGDWQPATLYQSD